MNLVLPSHFFLLSFQKLEVLLIFSVDFFGSSLSGGRWRGSDMVVGFSPGKFSLFGDDKLWAERVSALCTKSVGWRTMMLGCLLLRRWGESETMWSITLGLSNFKYFDFKFKSFGERISCGLWVG